MNVPHHCIVTVSVAMLREQSSKESYFLVITTSSRSTCRTSAVLCSRWQLGARPVPSVLIGGLGKTHGILQLAGCGFEAALCLEPRPCERGLARRLVEFFFTHGVASFAEPAWIEDMSIFLLRAGCSQRHARSPLLPPSKELTESSLWELSLAHAGLQHAAVESLHLEAVVAQTHVPQAAPAARERVPWRQGEHDASCF